MMSGPGWVRPVYAAAAFMSVVALGVVLALKGPGLNAFTAAIGVAMLVDVAYLWRLLHRNTGRF